MAYGDLDSFAYNSCHTNELININLWVPSEETHSCNNTNDKQFTNRCDKDIDTNLPSKTCCKNYSIEEFQTLKTNKTDLKLFQATSIPIYDLHYLVSCCRFQTIQLLQVSYISLNLCHKHADQCHLRNYKH